ncbi:G-protein coupled receptor 12-like [Clytia hemisphaerica]|uniref:G-protein coupled receptors family 1 profile domain-containing protein n=1 Tax=Clytia hemisphaerica TaxID=252671 RepID=A0A7M5V6K1_9CNID
MPWTPITTPNELDHEFWKSLNLSTDSMDKWVQNVNVLTLDEKVKEMLNSTDQDVGDDGHVEVMKIVFMIDASINILLNVLLFTFLVKYMARLKSKHVAKCFMNLQLSHLLFGVLLIVGQLVNHRYLQLITFGIVLQMFFAMMLKTLDQFIIIKYPYRYQRIQTRDLMFMMLATWLLTTFIILIIMFVADISNRQLTVILTFTIIISVLTLSACNFSVYVIARRHYVTIRGQYKKRSTGRIPKKPLLTCIAIVATFCLLWLPYLLHNVLFLGNVYVVGRSKLFSELVLFVASLNSIIDPVIFIWFNRDLKSELWSFKERNSTRRVKRPSLVNNNTDGSLLTKTEISS